VQIRITSVFNFSGFSAVLTWRCAPQSKVIQESSSGAGQVLPRVQEIIGGSKIGHHRLRIFPFPADFSVELNRPESTEIGQFLKIGRRFSVMFTNIQ
jgi:hypothetical protein